MTRWRPDFNPHHLYFVTTTAVNRANLFSRATIKRILVDCLYYMKTFNGVGLFAFVVMPNHIHILILCSEDYPLSAAMRDFKANSARLVVRQLQVERNEEALSYLASAVERTDRQKYKVWEDGYNAKAVFSPTFLNQKLSYIHNNPVQPQWDLVESPDEYLWSSARFYMEGEPALLPLDDLGEILG